MNPIVSVIMATYNGKDNRISESIDSVLDQTFTNFEFIIIDDCSTNDIAKTIFKYMKKDSRITYVKNESNLKLPESLNKGISLSKGKYIARIDDDDIWNDKTKLEKQVRFLEKNSEYGLCGVEYTIVIDEKGEEIDRWKYKTSDIDIRQHVLQANEFTHSSVVFTKESINNVGLYNEKYMSAQDYELWCRIGSRYKFANIEGLSVLYRINEKGISKTKSKLQNKNSRKIFRKNRKNYPNCFKAFIHRIIDTILPKKVILVLSSIKKHVINLCIEK